LAVLSEVTDFCRLWLFRHPELDEGHRHLAVGAGLADLSRRGRAMVLGWRQLTEGAELAAVYSSPQPQSLDPARGLCQGRELEPQADARLRDQEMGKWQGRAWAEIAQQEGDAVRDFFSEFGEAKAPGGESLGEAVERVLDWWTSVAPQGAGKSIAVVMPGALISGFTAAMLGMRLSRCISLNLPHGGLGVLDVFGNGVRIGCWNPGALSD
jgi:broad specificity phosphatase PhoE